MMRKMDEMEQAHALKAIRITFLYTMIFEVCYWIIECVRAQEIVTSSVVTFLIATQGIVLIVSMLLFKSKVGNPMGILGIILAVIFALMLLVVGYLFLVR